MADTRRLTIRPLERDDWPLVERLLGTRGACAGCWCMEMRNPRGNADAPRPDDLARGRVG